MQIKISKFTYIASGPIPQNADKCYQYLLLRLLTGTLKIKTERHPISQPLDYSIITPQPQTIKTSQAIKNILTAETTHRTIKSFIRSALANNRALYEDILLEFSNYFYQTNKGAHTAAFIFLYRIVERLSFSIPLLYTSQSKDYYATFSDLKNLLDVGGQGELGLLKKFLQQGQLIDKTILQIQYDIDFSACHPYGKSYYDALNRICDKLTDQDETRLTAKISFIDIHNLFISVRNRFLHSRTGDGQKNIKASEVNDSDEFFSALNTNFCSYISTITLQTITKMHTT